MKKVFLTVISFLSLTLSMGQIAYYDAISLSDTKNHQGIVNGKVMFNANPEQFEVIAHYVGSDITEDIVAAIKQNPFIALDLEGFDEQSKDNNGFSDVKEGSIIGSLDVTTFSRGLSQFLVSRAKAELNVAFFERLKKFFEKEENKQFVLLFPNTIGCLGNDFLANEYPAMLPVLQEAFQKDLDQLPDGIVKLVISKLDDKSLDDQYILTILNLFEQLKYIEHNSPPDFIEKLPEIFVFDGDPNLDETLVNIQSIFQISKELSHSLRTDQNDTEKYWQNSKDIYDNILKNDVTTRIYLGLLYQKIRDLKINGETIASLTTNGGTKLDILWYTSLITSFSTQIESIDYLYKSIDEKINNKTAPDFDEYYSYLTTIIDLTQFGVDIAGHYTKTDGIQSSLTIINSCTKVYEYTLSKQYNLAVYHTISLIESINKRFPEEKRISDITLSGLKTYGTFIGNVAVAKTSDDVEKSIEAVALPVGSSSVKKYNKNNLAIQAYLGPNLRVWIQDNESSTTWDNNWGITAPVGIGYTPWSLEKDGAFSFFLSVLDVGAIVDYELKEGNTNFEQKVYLKNIFSPGIHVVYGFGGNLPLSMGAGAQYGPGLLKINQGGVSIEPSWRASIFLAVDIPVINLYKGNRRKQ
nr:hypothetical protein [uncultured Carboxylicivirga sp.]